MTSNSALWGSAEAKSIADQHWQQQAKTEALSCYANFMETTIQTANPPKDGAWETFVRTAIRAEVPLVPIRSGEMSLLSVCKVETETGKPLFGSHAVVANLSPEDGKVRIVNQAFTPEQVDLLLTQLVDYDDLGLQPSY